jgi:hypothetical protein
MSSILEARGDPRFVRLLERSGGRQLDQSRDIIYGLWPDLTLAYQNAAWFRFAAENGEPAISSTWPIGRSVLDAVPGCLSLWCRTFVASALASGGSRPLSHEYECSSADVYRRFVMTAYPVPGPIADGVLVANSLRVEVPHSQSDQVPMPQAARNYIDAAGLIHQCAHCRRVRSVAEPLEWHWVPEWVRHARQNISHGLCETCLTVYYPVLDG